MALNIKNQETCDLAREVAQMTDDTMTGAITIALRQRRDQLKRERGREALLRDIRAIAERCSKLVEPGFTSADIDDLLYDEYGIPK
ncbi:MAG: PSK operon transcription factor [Chloroflexi bacterium]|nr:PSK operon transcription factor [Chloroflexota bacterium]MXZ02701.1 PSK operon transcription factor [Chloroflexota bacterium]MYK61591.1 PSK operon transcription factor [Chloroflexota bacterium]